MHSTVRLVSMICWEWDIKLFVKEANSSITRDGLKFRILVKDFLMLVLCSNAFLFNNDFHYISRARLVFLYCQWRCVSVYIAEWNSLPTKLGHQKWLMGKDSVELGDIRNFMRLCDAGLSEQLDINTPILLLRLLHIETIVQTMGICTFQDVHPASKESHWGEVLDLKNQTYYCEQLTPTPWSLLDNNCASMWYKTIWHSKKIVLRCVSVIYAVMNARVSFW